MIDKMKNIVLIGMPASGKSTVGVILAKILGMNFIDTDIVLQQNEGAKLRDILEVQGIDTFLAKEEEAILGISAAHSVIATGGSAVYSEAAMKHLAGMGAIVYLKVSFSKLRKRLHNIRGRGVVLRDGEGLEEMFAERSVLYERYSDITIEEPGSVEDTVRAVIDALNRRRGVQHEV